MLVSMKEILDRASAENYGVAAPNIATELDCRAVIEAAEELNAPIIIDIHNNMNPDISLLGHVAATLAMQSRVPVAINLDHGGDISEFVKAFKGQFTSVMVDRSVLPYEQNVAEVKEIVEMAHSIGISVEAELGHVGQGDNYAVDGISALTDPEEAARYIKDTGIDCLSLRIEQDGEIGFQGLVFSFFRLTAGGGSKDAQQCREDDSRKFHCVIVLLVFQFTEKGCGSAVQHADAYIVSRLVGRVVPHAHLARPVASAKLPVALLGRAFHQHFEAFADIAPVALQRK